MTVTLPNRLEPEWPRQRSSPAPSPERSRLRRLLRGTDADPRWARPALLALLGLTALLYLWGLGASGYANSFYAAAVQAGTKSWKAFFFGSSDAANFITVDKPPASLWVTGLVARAFGVNPWSVLVPQALEGVAAVGVLYATVRRWFSPAAGLLAGAVLALTPVATLMFRFNNPDALLTLLLVLGAYATVRALERGHTGWLVAAGAFVGFGFLTKMLQALLVVPAFALVYLACAPLALRRRLWQLAAAGVALVAAAGWWVAIVALVPASARPYVGGSQSNSILELTLGYNGFGRITGNETGSVGGGMGWGQTGLTRLFGADSGGQVSWLLPAALLVLAGGLWLTRRARRSDRTRAAFALWGGWLLVTGLVFSLMKGIYHPYYEVALAPAIAALVGMGAVTLWRHRERLEARALLAGSLALTAVWSFALLRRSPDWLPWLPLPLLLGGLAVAGLLLVAGRRTRGLATAVVAGGLLVALAGPAAYAIDTAATPHSGAIPSAGPVVAGGFGPGGRPGGQGGPGGQFGGQPPQGGQVTPFGGRGTTGGQGGVGGLLDAGTASDELVTLLRQGAKGYTWAAAAVGSNSAAGIQLASDQPVMAVGGFNGSDPAPTLAQFQQYVSQGKIHYFIAGGGMGGGPGGGGSGTSSQIASWVQQHFTAKSVGGTTVYDLTAPTGTTTTSA
jgi:4-amino-4-deoxy-L-arabinose transferase-like glycosyltransferase